MFFSPRTSTVLKLLLKSGNTANSAIDRQRCSGDKTGEVAGQEEDGTGDFLRLAHPAQCREIGVASALLWREQGHFSAPDHTGRYDVYAYALRAQFFADGSGKTNHSRFRGGEVRFA